MPSAFGTATRGNPMSAEGRIPVHESATYTVAPGGRLRGALRVPGDKSISHRAVILAAIAEGETEISGFL